MDDRRQRLLSLAVESFISSNHDWLKENRDIAGTHYIQQANTTDTGPAITIQT